MDKNKIMKKVLEKIDFINRYNSLLEKYSLKVIPLAQACRGNDVELVKKIMGDIGYKVGYNKREGFFYTKKEKFNNFELNTHFDLKDGVFEMMWIIKEGDKYIEGYPIHWLPNTYMGQSYLKKIIYSQYEQLEEIFTVLYKMYEDFKIAFLEAVKENCEYKNKIK